MANTLTIRVRDAFDFSLFLETGREGNACVFCGEIRGFGAVVRGACGLLIDVSHQRLFVVRRAFSL